MDDTGTRTGDNFSPVADERARVSALWQEVLGIPQVGLDDNFFESGGTSLLATVLLTRINRAFGRELSIAAIFESPTIRTMADHLRGEKQSSPEQVSPALKDQAPISRSPAPDGAVAIIGMTGRFPGAESVEDFWRNLAAGVESISFFDRAQLEVQHAADGYVAARPILENAEMFDAAFFGVYPKEAEQMDPQHRVFLECAWEVLERAGYDPRHSGEATGVFAGCSMNTYFMQNLVSGRSYLEEFTGSYQVGSYVTMLGNDKDFLATRVSYKLNLRGPSITVQSACSTSLVAVCQACQSLLAEGCEMALAGAVSITFPQRRGYLPQEGGLASLDGHCRPFDHRANGTVFGHGAAVLLLKRLDNAIRDGDQVLAVIRGCAVNNDGAGKAGYTAPGVEGQAQVIVRAQKMARIPADSITYIEAHGTGTPLGDPIEMAALTKAFRASTQAAGFCSVGTAKANLGHLDVAAGAVGLIKTVLQMEHRTIPKLLHFEQPNPRLDLAASPFIFDRELRPWKTGGAPLRAGVSAFGVGGTNAHIILEEPPQPRASGPARPYQLLTWSAKTEAAAENITGSLAGFLAQEPKLNLADAAYTLQMSRSRHNHRRVLVAGDIAGAHEVLATNPIPAAPNNFKESILREDHPFDDPGVVFCFSGQGIQSLGMGYALYQHERVFREYLDLCDQRLRPLLGESLLQLLYPDAKTAAGEERLNQTAFAQPAIFAVEYALAQLWLSWGIKPAAMVGHSIGEYVAACLAGVFPLDDALRLIVVRGRLMQELAPGSMLAVRAPAETVVRLMGSALDLAAINSPLLSVVSGAEAQIDAFSEQLTRDQIQNRKLRTSHAFHSRMVEPALEPFAQHLRTVTFRPPAIPFVSTLTGSWIAGRELAQPEYWTRQLRHTVRFEDAVRELIRTPQQILLEVGPGETTAQMMRQTALAAEANPPDGEAKRRAPVIISSLAGRRDAHVDEEKAILSALGRLWAAGADPDWQAFHAGYSRRRILLPTYPFERKRYWVEPPTTTEAAQSDEAARRGSGTPYRSSPLPSEEARIFSDPDQASAFPAENNAENNAEKC